MARRKLNNTLIWVVRILDPLVVLLNANSTAKLLHIAALWWFAPLPFLICVYFLRETYISWFVRKTKRAAP